MTTTTTYRVDGMTCDHCARAVTTEITGVEGVAAVDVDVARGEVTVTSETPLDDAAVRSAVEEAGYKVRT
ncbi:MAG: heavy-metal-associated domain-containing protein [Acidimicrobiales bacterium]